MKYVNKLTLLISFYKILKILFKNEFFQKKFRRIKIHKESLDNFHIFFLENYLMKTAKSIQQNYLTYLLK